MDAQLDQLRAEALAAISAAADETALDLARVKFLGQQGALTALSKGMKDVSKDDKSRELRDRIYDGIYDAGHHTTIQHPTFVFTLRKVSRQFIWSFLHAHPFYNSEQVSQRYVEV